MQGGYAINVHLLEYRWAMLSKVVKVNKAKSKLVLGDGFILSRGVVIASCCENWI